MEGRGGVEFIARNVTKTLHGMTFRNKLYIN